MNIHSATTPASAEAGHPGAQRMADGQVLQLRCWPVSGAAQGLLIVHGLGEHSGRHGHLAAWFNARGIDVRAYDQRGHGRSNGARGGLHRSDDLLTDLVAVYADYARHFERPPLLLGHSMGGLVAACAVLDGRVEPSALVLSSPALRSHASGAVRILAHGLACILPDLPMRSGLRLEGLTHDVAVIAAYRNDPLCHRRITPRLADFIFRAGAACIDDAASLAVSTLLLVAGADQLVDPTGSHDFAVAAAPGGYLTTHVFDGLYHELFNEAEPARGQVIARLGDWLDTHVRDW